MTHPTAGTWRYIGGVTVYSMSAGTAVRPEPLRPDATKAIVRRFATIVITLAVWSAVLFLCAGSLRYPRGWIYIVVHVLCFGVTAGLALRFNPQVAAARARRAKDAKSFDKKLSVPLSVLFFVLPAVAGLDAVRFGWTSMPFSLLYTGLVVFLLGTVPVTWAMLANPFLETMVRIQADRGHRVITTGPYAFVRHPMYSGMLLCNAGIPLILGSWWTFVPAMLINALFVWRTVLEDRTLRSELEGYAEYAGRTRYRLVPGIW